MAANIARPDRDELLRYLAINDWTDIEANEFVNAHAELIGQATFDDWEDLGVEYQTSTRRILARQIEPGMAVLTHGVGIAIAVSTRTDSDRVQVTGPGGVATFEPDEIVEVER